MNICIIPARGGSKRIPRKNIKQFHGKPLLAWSIEAAIKSKCFDRIICSTDDKEVATVARKYGAETPFVRPPELSDDNTGITPVVAYTIAKLQEQNVLIDSVCCIYATAPFIRINDLKYSLKILKSENVDYCFSVTEFNFPIQRSVRITKDNRCEMLYPEMFNKRSQDLENVYHDAGQFYWGSAKAWIQEKPLFASHSIPYVIPHYRVQDIDTLDDWISAVIIK